MDANKKTTMRWKPTLWFGVVVFLPLLAGCGSILPLSHTDRAQPPLIAADRGNGAGTQQVVPASFDSSEKSTAPQARFDLALFRQENRLPPPVEEKTTSNAENLPAVEKMTFDQAVTATLLADPKIRAGLEGITQARADLWTSSLFPNPTMLVDGLMLPTRGVTPERTSGPTQMDVFASYPIDWFLFGKRAAAMSSARLGVRQSESDYADLIRQRVATTATAFYDVVEAKELLKLAHEDLANLKKVEAITEKAVKGGNRAKVDLDRIRLDMLKSEQAVREAVSALEVAKAKLRSLFGRTDPDPAFDVTANIDAPLTAELVPLEKAYALAQENRPDIQSLRWQVDKARADVVVEDRKRFPEVTPAVGYTRQYQGPALAQPDADSWNVSITTTVPFFNRNQGNRMKAQSIAVQNRFNLDGALVDLRAEVTQTYQDFDTAQKNAQAIAQDQKKSAQDVLDKITQSFEAPGAGGMRYVDVLDAQRSYRDTYRAYISSRANYWRSAYRFSAAIGMQITPGVRGQETGVREP
jgi:cobalt-zinc-cadmium efflux system outer membrane protein